MAFPASAITLKETYEGVKRTARDLKRYAQEQVAAYAAGPRSANDVTGMYLALVQAKAVLDAAAAVPGLGGYARQQENNPSLDIAAEFTAMTNAVTAVGTWVTQNFPTGAGGHLLERVFTASGFTTRTFSSAETSGLRTQLNSLIATIA